MTSPDPVQRSASSSSQRATGFAVGLAIGLGLMAVLGLIGGVVAYSFVKKAEADARRGWNLVPVVVAATDMAEGTVVTFEMVAQRQVPEQFVTSSVVKPDAASYIVNQRLLVPVQAGDPMLWSAFEVSKTGKRSPVAGSGAP